MVDQSGPRVPRRSCSERGLTLQRSGYCDPNSNLEIERQSLAAINLMSAQLPTATCL